MPVTTFLPVVCDDVLTVSQCQREMSAAAPATAAAAAAAGAASGPLAGAAGGGGRVPRLGLAGLTLPSVRRIVLLLRRVLLSFAVVG
jgi:hypothetical protein